MKSRKKRNDPRNDTGLVFHHESEEESYKRYKHRCYRNLILEALLFFIIGLLFAAYLRTLKGGASGRGQRHDVAADSGSDVSLSSQVDQCLLDLHGRGKAALEQLQLSYRIS